MSSENGRTENGFIMVAVILVIAFLAIMGIGAVLLWGSAVSAVVSQHKSMEAYYLARSGADALSKWIIDHPGSVNEILGKTSATTTVYGKPGTVRVKLTKSGNGGLIIQSTGAIGGTTETLKLTMTPPKEGGFMFDKAIITKKFPKDIKGGVTISGGIEYQGGETLKIGGGAKVYGGVMSAAAVDLDGGAFAYGGIDTSSGISLSGGVTVYDGMTSRGFVTSDGGSYMSGGILAKDGVGTSKNPLQGTVSGGIKTSGDVNLTWGAYVSDGITANGNVYYPKNYTPTTSVSTGVTVIVPSFPSLTQTPIPAAPVGLENRDSIALPYNSSKSPWYINSDTITESGSYASIDLGGDSNLTIDTSSGTLTLFVGDLSVKGGAGITIRGTGTLILFVNNSFDMNGGTRINGVSGSRILVYSNNPSCDIRMQGGAALKSDLYIYAPVSSFTLSGDVDMTGSVVADSVSVSGGVSLKSAFLPMKFEGGNSVTYAVGSWSY